MKNKLSAYVASFIIILILLVTRYGVRYIGINAPELNNDNSCFGEEAKQENISRYLLTAQNQPGHKI